MRRIGWWISIILSFTCLVAFVSTAYSGETAKVGVLLHLTGDLADFGQIQKRSLLIALDEIQKGGDDYSKRIELIFQDMPMSPEKARSVVENLISEKQVVMLVGGISSVAAWEAALVAQWKAVPFLMSAATEDVLTEQGWDYVFRLNPPMSEFGNGMLWFLSEVVKPKTIAILRAKGFTGRLRSRIMIESCKNAGYEIVIDHLYEEDTRDFRPMLKQLKRKNPDVIAMASYLNDAVCIMRQCRELDINPLLFVGLGGGFTLPQFGDLAADAANYVCSISVWNPSVPYAGSKEFYEKYLDLYHTEPDFHGAEAYAAMQVVADVLRRTKSLDLEELRNALVSTDMTTIIGRVKFISYGKKTQQNRLPTYLVQWVGGNMKTVWPPRLACQEYIYPFPGWKRQ
jgi:branched-chain amino acid transport system substrate-binding protein